MHHHTLTSRLFCLSGLFTLLFIASEARAQRLAEVESPYKNPKVIEAQKAYDEAKDRVKESVKALTQHRLELQKILKSGTAATETFTNTTLKAAEVDLRNMQSRLQLLRTKLLAASEDAELKQLEANISVIETNLQKARLSSYTGGPDKLLISLSQRLNTARSELTRHENKLLLKNQEYALLSEEVSMQKKAIISIKKEMVVHRQNNVEASQQSPEAEAKKQEIATATEEHADLVKAQKEAKKAWEKALAEAKVDYATYLKEKKEREIRQQTRWSAPAGRAARRTGRGGGRFR